MYDGVIVSTDMEMDRIQLEEVMVARHKALGF